MFVASYFLHEEDSHLLEKMTGKRVTLSEKMFINRKGKLLDPFWHKAGEIVESPMNPTQKNRGH